MKRKDWTGGLFFIYLAFVIWVILLKFSTSPDALPHLRNINLIPYGDCLMVNGNLNIRELAGKYIDLCTIWNIWRYVGAEKEQGEQ